jgi:branched-chain amino acid transport system substrate-binding protein
MRTATLRGLSRDTGIVLFSMAALAGPLLAGCKGRSGDATGAPASTAPAGAAPASQASQSASPAAPAAADLVQFVPLPTFRVGAYASSGIPVWGGFIDYLTYVNEAEGGVDGVKLVYEECETEWAAEKGVECYERFRRGKYGNQIAIYNPMGAPAAYALSDKAAADKIPLVTLDYGRTEATDGAVFPYNFPVMLNFYSEASVLVNYVAQKVGGLEKLKGKKIATLYHDSAYGRETLDPLALLSKKYGFENIQIPLAHPGNEQSAQWNQVKRIKPDWVFLRGWGVMTPVAIKTAARVGFPAERIVGDVWSSSEEDVIPAGAAAKGYLAITTYPAGTSFELHKRLKQFVIDKGKSNLKNASSFGSIYYNSGVVMAIVTVEAIRAAQKHFGKVALNGEQGRWGLEHLRIDDARIRQIGVEGLMQTLSLSCTDHEGGGAAKIQRWDGKHWEMVSDWIKADRESLRPLIDSKSAQYANEKKVAPRDCVQES